MVSPVLGHRVHRLLDDAPDPHVEAARDAVHEAEVGRRLVVVDNDLRREMWEMMRWPALKGQLM